MAYPIRSLEPMKAFLYAALFFLLTLPVTAAYAKRAPNLELKDLNGHSQKLAALRGQVVVLNFWATWCGPCQEELPRLSKLAETYSGKNVHFVAVSIDDAKDRAKIRPTLARENVSLETWIGASTDTLSGFGLARRRQCRHHLSLVGRQERVSTAICQGVGRAFT